jgi:hypothetical protein
MIEVEIAWGYPISLPFDICSASINRLKKVSTHLKEQTNIIANK